MADTMPTPPSEPAVSSGFDIVAHYRNLLHHDHDINQPIAALESLIAFLSASPPSTVSETLALIKSATATLKESSPNSLSLSAGTDLFQRYIISSLQGSAPDFESTRSHLLSNSKLFIERAKEARGEIARIAKAVVQNGTTVLTCGHSRVVNAVLHAAADDGIAFRVIHAHSTQASTKDSSLNLLSQLRRKNVPVAEIHFTALAEAARKATFALVGAESVVENGGIVSSMGTQQIGILMKTLRKPLYVAAESHKFVRVFPLSPEDLGLGENVLDFRSSDKKTEPDAPATNNASESYASLDLTPPDLITALITESGFQQPNAVSEELIKIW